ncbi:hypothetical protein ACFPT1_01520 [Carnobacterium antarcticum]|nr:hypothetical protein NY10_1747 [Carnobacterium sp. CP1]
MLFDKQSHRILGGQFLLETTILALAEQLAVKALTSCFGKEVSQKE